MPFFFYIYWNIDVESWGLCNIQLDNTTFFFAFKLSIICFHFINIKEKSRCQAYLISHLKNIFRKKISFHYSGFENWCEIYIFHFTVYRITDVKTLVLNFKVHYNSGSGPDVEIQDFTSIATWCERMWTYHIMSLYTGYKLMWKIIFNWCKESFL